MTWIHRSEILWFSQDFVSFDFDDFSFASDFLRTDAKSSEVGNQPTDGCDGRTREAEFVSVLLEQRMYFFLSKVFVYLSDSSQLIECTAVPHSLSFVFWYSFDRIE